MLKGIRLDLFVFKLFIARQNNDVMIPHEQTMQKLKILFAIHALLYAPVAASIINPEWVTRFTGGVWVFADETQVGQMCCCFLFCFFRPFFEGRARQPASFYNWVDGGR